VTGTRLDLTRPRILAFRQNAGGLGERLPRGEDSEAVMTVQPWRRLSPAERDAVVAEAEALPLSTAQRRITVRWDD